ncbi:hypothetical protein FAIPA1_10283 [Frankia sp. AiPs1]
MRTDPVRTHAETERRRLDDDHHATRQALPLRADERRASAQAGGRVGTLRRLSALDQMRDVASARPDASTGPTFVTPGYRL